jgi:hypothetical protein
MTDRQGDFQQLAAMMGYLVRLAPRAEYKDPIKFYWVMSVHRPGEEPYSVRSYRDYPFDRMRADLLLKMLEGR